MEAIVPCQENRVTPGASWGWSSPTPYFAKTAFLESLIPFRGRRQNTPPEELSLPKKILDRPDRGPPGRELLSLPGIYIHPVELRFPPDQCKTGNTTDLRPPDNPPKPIRFRAGLKISGEG